MIEIKKHWYKLLFTPACLILFLVIAIVSFSGGKVVTTKLGQLAIQIREIPSQDGTAQLDQINILYKGLSFKISRKFPIVAYDTKEKPMALYPISYKEDSSSFYINLNAGAMIKLRTGATDTILELNIPSNLNLSRIDFPFSASGLKIEGSSDIPVLALNPQGEDEFFLSLSGNSKIDIPGKKLLIVPGISGKASITLGVPSGGKSVFVFWYRTQGREITERQFKAGLKDYMDKSYQGFKNRLDTENLLWSYNGEKDLRPETIIAYAAESIEREQYPDIQETLSKIADSKPEKSGFFPVVYTGNLQYRTEEFYSKLNKNRANIIRDLKNGNFDSLVSFYDIFDTLIIDGSPYLAKAVQDAINALSEDNISPKIFASLVRLLIKQKQSQFSLLDVSKIEDIIDNYIFKSIKLTQRGLFFINNEGKADMMISIATGAALTQEAEETGDENLKSIARDLILSSIKMSDEYGKIPEKLNPNTGTKEGTIFPEDIYPLIKSETKLPRTTIIAKDGKIKGWIFSLVSIENIKISDKEESFEFDFPVGWIHHMVINGVREYKRLEILKLTWRTTRLFEQYPMGAYFTPENRTLYIKYQHRDTRERVVISYQSEE
ncbi:hypothetical protein WKV44_02110 [Spirochaetia bacterium 38H-sp]|uniref:Uncharacterized protein n=1 Tax=Rarispira pelagica TaxID=3141764 RepID=A0ABU9U9I6_9SPIR